MEEVLTSGEVDAVLLILPVQAMPSVARRALAAGKAVLQEKPVAGTVTEALKTLEAAREAAAAAAKKNKNSNLFPVFALAENYRSEPGVLAAADAARKLSDPTSKKGNNVTTVSLVGNMPMNRSNRYHGSQWRRDAQGCPGCFLMDSCVHFVAALRSVSAAAGLGEVARVGTRAGSRCDGEENDLPAPDTLVSWLEFENAEGTANGTVSVTFAGAAPRFALTLDTRRGAVELSRGAYGGGNGNGGRGAGYSVAVTAVGGGGGAEAETASEFHPFGGLEGELESFLRLARGRGTKADAAALSPASAARDLGLIEAMLRSSEGSGAPVEVERIGGGAEGGEELDPLETGFGVAL